MISEVLRDLPFSRNQTLKSAEDQYIEILKNTLILKKLELGTSFQPVVPCTHTHTHTEGSKLRRQTPTKHMKNICEPLRVISVNHTSVLPDDGSHTIRNMLGVIFNYLLKPTQRRF